METVTVKSKENVKNEIIRFTITGIITTIIDFGFYTLTAILLQKIMDPESMWITILSTFVGFTCEVILSYFLSVRWVFKDVDKKKGDKLKGNRIIMFILLSLVGLIISITIMSLCKLIFKKTLNININTWMYVGVSFRHFFKWLALVLSSLTFWMYAISFILKKVGGLIFNYITRKKIVFKKSK